MATQQFELKFVRIGRSLGIQLPKPLLLSYEARKALQAFSLTTGDKAYWPQIHWPSTRGKEVNVYTLGGLHRLDPHRAKIQAILSQPGMVGEWESDEALPAKAEKGVLGVFTIGGSPVRTSVSTSAPAEVPAAPVVSRKFKVVV